MLVISATQDGLSLSVSAAREGESGCPQGADLATDCHSSTENAVSGLGCDEDDMFVSEPYL